MELASLQQFRREREGSAEGNVSKGEGKTRSFCLRERKGKNGRGQGGTVSPMEGGAGGRIRGEYFRMEIGQERTKNRRRGF